MAITVAELVAKVGIDSGEFNRGMRSVDDKIDDTHSKSKVGFGGISTAAKVAGAAVVGGLGLAIHAAANFEGSLNTLQAVSGATGKEMDGMRKHAIALGNDVKLPGTSAQDAAEAMTEMVKAGVSLKDTQKGVRDVLVLSAAAQVSNADAAEIAANALNAFGLKGKDVKFVTDQLANAANASSIDIKDAADSMKMAGSVFSGVQGPTLGAKGAFHELETAVALLGNAGIKGSDAGTSLKQMMLQLTGPSDKAKASMKALYDVARQGNPDLAKGGDIAYDNAGKMRSLPEIIDLVTKGTKNMTAEQKNAYITQIFGADASRSVIALMKQQGEGWDNMSDKLNKQGAAQEVANAKMKGFNGSMEAFKSTLDTLAITFGSVLLPAATQIMHVITDLVGAFAAHKTIALILVGAIATFAATYYAITTAMKVYRAALVVTEAAQWALNVAMEANPIGIIIVALVALGVALVVAYKKSATFREIVNDAFDVLKRVVSVAINASVKAIETLIDAFMAIEKGVKKAFEFFEDLPAFIGRHWKEIMAIILPGTLLFTNAFGIRSAVVGKLEDVFNGVVSIVSKIAGAITDMPGKIAGFASALGTKVIGEISSAGANIAKDIADRVGRWAGAFGDIVGKVAAFGGDLGNKIIDRIANAGAAVAKDIAERVGRWGDAFGDIVGHVATFGAGLATKIIDRISNAGATVAADIAERVGRWGEAFGGIVGKVAAFGKDLGEKIIGRIREAGSSVASDIVDRVGHWADLIGDLPGKAAAAIRHDAHLVANAVGDIFDGIADWIKKVLRIASPSEEFADIGRNIVRGLVKGLRSEGSHLADVAHDLAVKVLRGLEHIPRDLWDALPSGVRSAISDTLGAAEHVAREAGAGAAAAVRPFTGAGAGGSQWDTMIGAANALDRVHYPYSWGGGHNAAFAPSGPFNGYDCSGAVSFLMHSIGLLGFPMVSGSFGGFGRRGRGPATILSDANHVYMMINGSGWGTSRSNPGGGAGWFPGWWDASKTETVPPGFPLYDGRGHDAPSAGAEQLPGLARGGIVRARPGGRLVVAGEGLYDEAVVPLPRGWGGMGGNVHVHLNVQGHIITEDQTMDWIRSGLQVASRRGA